MSSKPAEAWYSYTKQITKRYPHNRHPEEDAAVAAALKAARPDTQRLIELVYIQKAFTLREAANRCYLSYPAARNNTSLFFGEVARNLKLPCAAKVTYRVREALAQYPDNLRQEDREAVAAVLEASNSETRSIIECVYIEKHETIKDAAKRCGISEGTAKRRKSNFMQCLAEKLPAE